MRYCLHSNNNNGKNQGAMTIETLQWTTFHSTMARSTFNFNKTAITITSLKFLMRVCVRVLRLPNVEKKKQFSISKLSKWSNIVDDGVPKPNITQFRVFINFLCTECAQSHSAVVFSIAIRLHCFSSSLLISNLFFPSETTAHASVLCRYFPVKSISITPSLCVRLSVELSRLFVRNSMSRLIVDFQCNGYESGTNKNAYKMKSIA